MSNRHLLGNIKALFSKWVYDFIHPVLTQERSGCSTFSPKLDIIRLFSFSQSGGCKVVPYCDFNLLLLVSKGVEYLYIRSLVICMLSSEKCLPESLPFFFFFFDRVVSFSYDLKEFLRNLHTSTFSGGCIPNIRLGFSLLIVFYCEQNFNFYEKQLLIFFLQYFLCSSEPNFLGLHFEKC